MQIKEPFNPLDKENLGTSVAEAMLHKPVLPLRMREKFEGAGIYAIYYNGDFEPYAKISDLNDNQEWSQPIYVGKAIPAGARKGGVGLNLPAGTVLHKRLSEHAKSIEQASNLDVDDFSCRYLIADDIWIPLGESLLIENFRPLWNVVIDGFGNHDPGKGRYRQQRSPWDVLHPGRAWAMRCAEGKPKANLIELIKNHDLNRES